MIKYLLDNHNKVFYKCDLDNRVEKEFFEYYMSNSYTSQIHGDEELNRECTYFDATEYVENKRKSSILSNQLNDMNDDDKEFRSTLAEYFYFSDQAHYEEESLRLYNIKNIESMIKEIPDKEREAIEYSLKQSDLDF